MKTLSTKKILITLFTLVFISAMALLGAFGYKNAYAEMNPDSIAAYDAPATPDESVIAPPVTNPDDPTGDTGLKNIGLDVKQLKLEVTDWKRPASPTSTAKFNFNPDNEYSPELVAKIKGLETTLVKYSVKDMNGNVITDIATLSEGSTYFVHVDVADDYAKNVKIVYAEGIERSLAGQIDFLGNPSLTGIDKIDKTEYEIEFDGTAIDMREAVLNEVLKGKDHCLVIVESESDKLTQSAVGEYHYRICFKPDAKFCWKPSTSDRTPVDIVVKVSPKTIEVKKDLGKFNYTGLEIDAKEKLTELYGDYVVVASGYDVSAEDHNKEGALAKNVGIYKFHILINPKYNGSVAWENNVKDPVEVTWEIIPSEIKGEWKEPASSMGRLTVTSDTGYVLQSGDIKYTYKDKDGNVVTQLQVGQKYTATAELSEKVIGNLVWVPAAPDSFEFTLSKEIVIIQKPVLDAITREYTGKPLTFEVKIDGKPLSDFADKVEIVSTSNELTQTAVGKYKVVIRLKDEAASWPEHDTGDVILEFEVTKVEIDVKWDEKTGSPTFTSSLTDNYSNIIEVTYKDAGGMPVAKSDMKKGQTYTAVATIKDANFKWKSGAKPECTFTLDVDFIPLTVPVLSVDKSDFKGDTIKIEDIDKATYDQIKEYMDKGYADIIDGQLAMTNSGSYEIVLKVKAPYIWKDTEGDYVKLTFTINKAVPKGSWNNSGKVDFEKDSYTKNYDDVVEYIYKDKDGNEVAYKDLVEGQTYTASIRIKPGQENNFDGTQLPADKEFTYSPEKKNPFPWWIFLIIAALLLIAILLILFFVLRRRKKDDEYDDYYDDEYYGDEEGDGNAEGEEGDEEGDEESDDSATY